ncbi:hypothetical protein KFE25_007660 [Diacronema lutheri]|uniref:Uncharacterized protein n=1 Tax=Diacronema lutheri TaxID=2081491 RepID=A0A8J5XVE8_DIALT|nr:hypothetical protein KFE25_007660 [Diacronema lutheri]
MRDASDEVALDGQDALLSALRAAALRGGLDAAGGTARAIRAVGALMTDADDARRAACLRTLRYVCATPACWASVHGAGLDTLVSRALQRGGQPTEERVQALKLVRAALRADCGACADAFASALVRVARDGADALRLPALESLRDFAARHAEAAAAQGTLLVLVDAIVPAHAPDAPTPRACADALNGATPGAARAAPDGDDDGAIVEPVVLTLLLLLDLPSTRAHARPALTLARLSAPLLALHAEGSTGRSERAARVMALMLRSWTGLILLAASGVLSSVIGALAGAGDDGLRLLIDLVAPCLLLRERARGGAGAGGAAGARRCARPLACAHACAANGVGCDGGCGCRESSAVCFDAPADAPRVPPRARSRRRASACAPSVRGRDLVTTYRATALLAFLECGLVAALEGACCARPDGAQAERAVALLAALARSAHALFALGKTPTAMRAVEAREPFACAAGAAGGPTQLAGEGLVSALASHAWSDVWAMADRRAAAADGAAGARAAGAGERGAHSPSAGARHAHATARRAPEAAVAWPHVLDADASHPQCAAHAWASGRLAADAAASRGDALRLGAALSATTARADAAWRAQRARDAAARAAAARSPAGASCRLLVEEHASWRLQLCAGPARRHVPSPRLASEQPPGPADEERLCALLRAAAIGRSRDPIEWGWDAIVALCHSHLRERERVAALVRSGHVKLLLQAWRPDQGPFVRTRACDSTLWLVYAGCELVDALAATAEGAEQLCVQFVPSLARSFAAWALQLRLTHLQQVPCARDMPAAGANAAAAPSPPPPLPPKRAATPRAPSAPRIGGGGAADAFATPAALVSGAAGASDAHGAPLAPCAPPSLLRGTARSAGSVGSASASASASASGVASASCALPDALALVGTLGLHLPALVAVLASSPRGSRALHASGVWGALAELLSACDCARARAPAAQAETLLAPARAIVEAASCCCGAEPAARSLLEYACGAECEALRLCAVRQLGAALHGGAGDGDGVTAARAAASEDEELSSDTDADADVDVDAGVGAGAGADAHGVPSCARRRSEEHRWRMRVLAARLADQSSAVAAIAAGVLERACDAGGRASSAALTALVEPAALDALLAASSGTRATATESPGSDASAAAVTAAAYTLLCRLAGTRAGLEALDGGHHDGGRHDGGRLDSRGSSPHRCAGGWIGAQLEQWRDALALAFASRVEAELLAELREFDEHPAPLALPATGAEARTPSLMPPRAQRGDSARADGDAAGGQRPAILARGAHQLRAGDGPTDAPAPASCAPPTPPARAHVTARAEDDVALSAHDARLEDSPAAVRARTRLRGCGRCAGAPGSSLAQLPTPLPTPLRGAAAVGGGAPTRIAGADAGADSFAPLRQPPPPPPSPRVHLYGQLARTAHGRTLLRPALERCVRALADAAAAPRERRAAAWAVAHVAASIDGSALAAEVQREQAALNERSCDNGERADTDGERQALSCSGGAIALLAALARRSRTLSLRGSCACALGFLGKFVHAHDALDAAGWAPCASGPATPTGMEGLFGGLDDCLARAPRMLPMGAAMGAARLDARARTSGGEGGAGGAGAAPRPA